MHREAEAMSRAELSPFDASNNVSRLRRVLEAAKLLNSTIDIVELTGIILKMVRDEVGIDRGTVFIVDQERQELRSIVAQDVEGTGIRLPFGSGIAGAVASTGEIIDLADAYTDGRFNPQIDAALNYVTRDIFCMPVVNREGRITGVLELLNRKAPFTEDDREFLANVSVHIGLALENAWLHRQLLEKRKMEQDLLLAREIQQNLYPTLPERRSDVQIAASSTMCDAVGGDYLDYYPLRDRRFVLLLGDVSGKGIGAALVMTSLHATCRALLRHVEPLERIGLILNDSLLETTHAQTYVTLIAVLVNPVGGTLHCVRAGHLPALLVSEDGKSRWLEEGGGLPIGLFPEMKLTREVYDLPRGSVVVLYTDGITEAESPSGEHFGLGRISRIAEERHKASAREIHDAIRAEWTAFMGDGKPSDDSTLVVLKFG
jgi:serine phosphatase RsbU (regulator of sigma subunit)